MPPTPKVLAFAGSSRTGSFNSSLIRIAARGVTQAGAECTLIDLADFELPIYGGDLEAAGGLPEAAARLRALLADHQGLLIASPEYNSSIPPVLKNTIDWSTRSSGAQPDLSGYAGKYAALLSASPGPLGGQRGLLVVRSLLTNIGVTVLANQLNVRQAMTAFDDNGNFVDDGQRGRAEAIGAELARLLIAVQP
jgi:chromate reductase